MDRPILPCPYLHLLQAYAARIRCILLFLLIFSGMVCVSPSAAVTTIDFETDDGGNVLINGQAINSTLIAPDTVAEFGNVVNIGSRVIGSGGHLGPAIFDSTPGGPNAGSQDPDLLVGLGNVLMLQNNDSPGFSIDPTYGKVFDLPNDEATVSDRGAIVFDFLNPVELLSIDLIDVNGGVNVIVTLTDAGGDQRVYDVPTKWTTDLTVALNGWQTLDLTTLLPQPSEVNAIGGDAVVTLNDPGFDPQDVIQLDVAIVGSSPSGALDNIVFIPEPGAMVLLGLGALGLRRRRKA